MLFVFCLSLFFINSKIWHCSMSQESQLGKCLPLRLTLAFVYSVWKPGRAPTAGGKRLLFKHTKEHTWWWPLAFPSSNKTVRTNGACNSLQSIKQWFCHFLSMVNSFIMFHNGIGTLITTWPSFPLNDMAELLRECLTPFHPVCTMLACICLQWSLMYFRGGYWSFVSRGAANDASVQFEPLVHLPFSLFISLHCPSCSQ